MDEGAAKRDWTGLVTRVAVALSIGALAAALIAAMGSGAGLWHFRPAFTVLRWAFYAAAAGAVLALAGLFLARRSRQTKLLVANAIALAVALAFLAYLASQAWTARSVPAIHDVATNLDDLPQFSALPVRADNLAEVPADDRPELAALPPEARWKALHRQAYGDIRPVQVATDVPETIRRAEALAKERGWEIARVDTAAGTLEATATTTFFRFKDDVVIRARPLPGGGSIVDMRSVSRVGVSDVGANAKRIRSFLDDLEDRT